MNSGLRRMSSRVRSDRSASQLQLVVKLARRQIDQRYRESLFGAGWTLLNPLVLLGIYWFVFSEVFGSKWSGPGSDRPYALLMFSGIILFNMFAEIVNGSTFLVQSNALLIKRTTVSSRVLPLAAALSAVFTLCLNLIPFFVMYVVLERELPPPTALLMPIVVLPVVVLSAGIAEILASGAAYFRDLQQIIPLITTSILFLSPIFFPASSLPASVQPWVENFGPLSVPLAASKDLLFLGEIPDLSSFMWYSLGSAIVFILGWRIYGLASKGFADVV